MTLRPGWGPITKILCGLVSTMPAQLSAQRRSGSAASSPRSLSALSNREDFVGSVISFVAQNGSSPELNGLGAVHTPRTNLNPTTHLQHPRASPGQGAAPLAEAPSASSSEALMAPHSSQNAPDELNERASTAERDIWRALLHLPHTPFTERSQYQGGPSQSPQPFGDVSPSPQIHVETTTTPNGTKKEGQRPSVYGYFGYGATIEQAANGSQPLNSTISNTSVRSNSTRAGGMNTPGGRRKAYPTVLKNVEREITTDAHGRRQSVYRESDIRSQETAHCSPILTTLHMTGTAPRVN